MKKAIGVAAVIGAIAAFTVMGGVTPIAGQTPAPGDQTIKAEVNAFMDTYWELFSAGRIDELAERIYHPSGQLSNAGHASVADLKSRFPSQRKTMVDAGYGRSNMPMRNICVVSPTVAIVSGRGIRYLTDGRVMAEFGWTYTLLKGSSGWRMVAIYTHDPNKVVGCSS